MPMLTLRFLLPALCIAAAAVAQCAPQWQPGDPYSRLQGSVHATGLWDPDGAGPAPLVLVAAGSFRVGTTLHQVATFDGGQWVPLGPQLTGIATAMAIYNGQPVVAGAGRIHLWNGAAWQQIGTFTSSQPNTFDQLRVMALYQGDLIVGGALTSVNGVSVGNLARWNGSSWSALGSGTNGIVEALAVYSNQLYVGGAFSRAGGVTAGNLAAWNGSAWLPTASVNGTVWSLAARNATSAPSSYLFVGGSFTNVGGVPVDSIARFVAATNTWTALGTMGAGQCTALFVRSTGINSYELVAGSGYQVWRWGGSAWNTLGVNLGGNTTQFSYYAGRYVVGVDDTYGFSSGIRSYDGTNWEWIHGLGITDEVLAVLPVDDQLVIGGRFRTISGVTMNGVAIGDSNNWQPLGNGLLGTGGSVTALARLPNGDLVAGGDFSVATGGAADRIARWDGTSWQPLGGGRNGKVTALALHPSGDLYVGGTFSLPGTTPGYGVARWNGSNWSDLGGGINGSVNALALLDNGDLIVGGTFSQVGNPPLSAVRIARWDGSAWHALGNGLNDEVLALTVTPGGHLVAGGRFTGSGVAPLTRVGRWDGSAWSQLWSGGILFTQPVHALTALPNGDVIAGGDRSQLPNTVYENLVRVRASTYEALGVGGNVRATALAPNGDLIVVGSMSPYHVAASHVARLAVICPATALAYGSGCVGAGGLPVLTATTLPWDSSTLRARTTGLPASSLAFTLYGFAAISVPIVAVLPEGLPGCNLLVTPDILGLAAPTAGALETSVFIAPSPSLVGATFYHQVVPIEIAGGQVTGITATNGLALTVGSY